jgi:hypothetical protein
MKLLRFTSTVIIRSRYQDTALRMDCKLNLTVDGRLAITFTSDSATFLAVCMFYKKHDQAKKGIWKRGPLHTIN